MNDLLNSTLHLVPEWITRLIEDYEVEALEATNSWALKLLAEGGRRAVWNMCYMLGVDAHGVPGQACRLLERYLLNYVQECMSCAVFDIEAWTSFKRSLASRIPLLMASCAQLAAKMNSVSLPVNATLVRTCLLCKGIVFSVEDIIRSEFNVFSTLDFRMPLWTSLEVAQVLSLEVGLPPSALEGVALVVNIAEYRRDRLAAAVRRIAGAPSSSLFNASVLGTLHLSAGAVAASARYLPCGGPDPAPDPAPRLAELTCAPLAYIRCVSDVILADILLIDDTPDAPALAQRGSSRKRKISY